MKQGKLFWKLGSSLLMLLFMVNFTVPADAAVPDVGKKATTTVQESPGYTSAFQVCIVKGEMMAVNQEDSMVKELVAKSAAINQNPVNSQDLYLAAKNEAVRNIEDLQAAVVPPLIAFVAVNGNVHKIGSQTNSLIEITKPIATMEGFASEDIAITSYVTLNLLTQFPDPADLKNEPAVQLKKPQISTSSVLVSDEKTAKEGCFINQMASAETKSGRENSKVVQT